MTAVATNARAAALDKYIVERGTQGFKVESRSGYQAVLVRRHPLYFLVRRFGGDRAQQRFVISVDEHAHVIAVRAQPLRW